MYNIIITHCFFRICSPSCDPNVLRDRQDAVEYLMKDNGSHLTKKMDEHLKKLPDLEKLLQKFVMAMLFCFLIPFFRINTLGLLHRSDTSQHPDARAQMFFKDNYNNKCFYKLLF